MSFKAFIGSAPNAWRPPRPESKLGARPLHDAPPAHQHCTLPGGVRHPGVEAFGEGLPSPSLISTKHTWIMRARLDTAQCGHRSKATVQGIAAQRTEPGSCKAVWAETVSERVNSRAATEVSKVAHQRPRGRRHTGAPRPPRPRTTGYDAYPVHRA